MGGRPAQATASRRYGYNIEPVDARHPARFMNTLRSRIAAALSWAIRNARPSSVHAAVRDCVSRLRQRRWAAAKAGAAQYLERRTAGRMRMRFYLDSRVCRPMYVGTFEPDEQRFVERLLKPGDRFYDIGAHYGLFTLIASRRVGRSGRVVAIEPTPETRARLDANLGLNSVSNVDVLPVAVSDSSGQVRMSVSTTHQEAWNSLAPTEPGSGFEQLTVPSVTLDGLVAERGEAGRIALLKIDVEGWERHVLRGARMLLQGADAPVLTVEFSDIMMQRDGSSCCELYRDLVELGYAMYTYDAGRNRMIEEPCRRHYGYANLIACKSLEAVNARLGAK